MGATPVGLGGYGTLVGVGVGVGLGDGELAGVGEGVEITLCSPNFALIVLTTYNTLLDLLNTGFSLDGFRAAKIRISINKK